MQRVPPQNIEAEQSVLGAIFLENQAIVKASDFVAPDDFYKDSHRHTYRAMLDLFSSGKPIDLITVPEELRARGHLERCGGVSYISSLVNSVPNAANIHYHSKIIKANAQRRKLIIDLHDLLEEAYSPGSDVRQLTDKGITSLTGAVASAHGNNPSASSAVASIQGHREAIAAGRGVSIDMTINRLRQAFPGYYPGHMWLIYGYTSAGKTAFINQLTLDALYQGGRVVVFSLEESRDERMMGLLSNRANIPKKFLIMGEVPAGMERILADAEEEAARWPIWIYDDVRTLDGIRRTIKKHKMTTGVDIVIIDYVQILDIPGEIYNQMTAASKEIYNIGLTEGVCTITLSQTGNAAARGEDGIIGTLGGGALGSAADAVIKIKRNQMDEGQWHKLDILIEKNRKFGYKYKTNLFFSEQFTRIQEMQD